MADVIPLKRSAAALDSEQDDLLDELDALRVSGLASFEIDDVPLVAQLVRDIGLAHNDGDVTVADIRRQLGRAIGSLDNNKMLSPAAALFALREDDDLGAELHNRMTAAANCHKIGMTVRGYSGSPPKGKKTADLRRVRDALQTMLRDVQQPQPPKGVDVVLVEAPMVVDKLLDGQAGITWTERRQAESSQLWQLLCQERDRQIGQIGPLSNKLCIFASGSYGRDEAMEWSDVDLFLVDDCPGKDSERHGTIDKFELGAALTVIDRSRQQRNIQQFSQGGYYQETQSFHRMLVDGGTRHESPSRLTTARALLLANSKCFWNEDLYAEMQDRAMQDYWRDHVGAASRPLRPTFLINDLRRLWLTQLVDFEHFFPKENIDGRWVSGTRRQIAGLKLAVPQQLGCYTPILGLLERCGPDGVRRADAEQVLRMTTQQRLLELSASDDADIARAASSLRELYGQYLKFSWCEYADMSERVNTRDWPEIKAHFNNAARLILAMLWRYQARVPDIARYALV